MKRLPNLHRFLVLVVMLFATIARADDLIPKAAWRRPLGLALENPGTSRVHGDIDVSKFANGEMGAVNGVTSDGSVINDNEQAREVWVGTSFGLAALLLSEGMREEAYRTAWGLYHVIYESKGYWFRTPEAWDANGNFRASMYMRPAAIWAMQMVNADAN
jgi:uncharacterized protein (DUF608 family)